MLFHPCTDREGSRLRFWFLSSTIGFLLRPDGTWLAIHLLKPHLEHNVSYEKGFI
jgi:hypothetical protein